LTFVVVLTSTFLIKQICFSFQKGKRREHRPRKTRTFYWSVLPGNTQ
jgi:hypothetical protein